MKKLLLILLLSLGLVGLSQAEEFGDVDVLGDLSVTGNTTLSNLTASQAVMTDSNKKLVSADYLNQAVKNTSSPTFVNLNLSGLNVNGTANATTFYGNLTGELTGNVTGNVSGNAGTVTNGVYTTDFVRGTFTNANLTAGVLTVTHNKSLSSPFTIIIRIFNNLSKQIEPDDITGYTNTTEVDLTSYGNITGTWGYEYTK